MIRDAAAPLVSLRGVGKTYANGVRALDGFELDVRKGEFVSLLGPSGCGKSTVLRLVAGLAPPTSGTLASIHSDSGTIGFVFQEPTLMPWASVADNVALPLRLSRMPDAAKTDRVARMIDRVGLSGFASAYPRELSGGMKMRVSLARALVTEPALLLLDEPFAALDELTRFKLNDDLLALWHALGTTIVFVTHSVFESVYLSQRVVVMTPRPGRVAREIAIDAGAARSEDFRTSTDFAQLSRAASDALRAAMQEHAAA